MCNQLRSSIFYTQHFDFFPHKNKCPKKRSLFFVAYYTQWVAYYTQWLHIIGTSEVFVIHLEQAVLFNVVLNGTNVAQYASAFATHAGTFQFSSMRAGHWCSSARALPGKSEKVHIISILLSIIIIRSTMNVILDK